MVEVKYIKKAVELPSSKNPSGVFGKTDPDKKKIKSEYGDFNLDDYRVETV